MNIRTLQAGECPKCGEQIFAKHSDKKIGCINSKCDFSMEKKEYDLIFKKTN